MTVSAVILEIFSVKKWPDLENRVRVHSRSLEMAPFDRSRMSSYSPSIVNMAISCIVYEYTDILALYLAHPQGVTPSEFREDLDIHKTRMNGLSCGEESMTIYSAVLIPCQRVTERRTDRRTDVQPISITCFSIADARKNVNGTKRTKKRVIKHTTYVRRVQSPTNETTLSTAAYRVEPLVDF